MGFLELNLAAIFCKAVKTLSFLFILLFGSLIAQGQNIHVRFNEIHESTMVDSVIATNMCTGQSITIPGNETLILDLSSGIENIKEPQKDLRLFPNPFQNTGTLTFYQPKSEKVQRCRYLYL